MNVRAMRAMLVVCVVAALSGCGGTGGGGGDGDDHVAVWQTVGDGISTGVTLRPAGLSVAACNGVTYVAYADAAGAGNLHVQKYSGGSWSFVGTDPVATSVFMNTAEMTLAVADENNIYVTYNAPSAAATIVKYDGTSWAAMTNPFPAGASDSPRLALDGATPYVLYENAAVSYAKSFTTAWNPVGASFAGYCQELCLYGGVPYAAYRQIGGVFQASVKAYTTSWQQVGNPNISPDLAGLVSLFSYAESGQVTHYVAYMDQTTTKITVKKNTGAAAWNTLGVADFTPTVNWLSIRAYNGTPYLAYMTTAMTPYVEKFNGTTWELLGGVSPLDQVDINPNAFCMDGGTPCIAMFDFDTLTVIVKRFE